MSGSGHDLQDGGQVADAGQRLAAIAVELQPAALQILDGMALARHVSEMFFKPLFIWPRIHDLKERKKLIWKYCPK